jgi:hypothetical protein
VVTENQRGHRRNLIRNKATRARTNGSETFAADASFARVGRNGLERRPKKVIMAREVRRTFFGARRRCEPSLASAARAVGELQREIIMARAKREPDLTLL